VSVYYYLHHVPQADDGYVPVTHNPHYYENCQHNKGERKTQLHTTTAGPMAGRPIRGEHEDHLETQAAN
jgi:hypothetical protein